MPTSFPQASRPHSRSSRPSSPRWKAGSCRSRSRSSPTSAARSCSGICQSTLKDAEQQVQIFEKGVLKAFERRTMRRQAMNPDLAWAVWCGERQRRIEDVLERALPAADRVPSRSVEAMRYAVLDGGKRMRPLLAYAAGELADADPEPVDAAAAAVELSTPIRSSTTTCLAWTTTRCAAASRRVTSRSARRWRSSPAMRCRRSRSACSPTARLRDAGSARARCSPKPPACAAWRAGRRSISAASGAALSQAELETMHRMKTGALIRASVRLGAACGRPLSADEAAALDAYAAAAGLAFQVTDDVLDVEGSAHTLGKTAGKDVAQGKPTFVTCSGSPRPRERAEALARGGARGARALRRRRHAGSPSSPTGSCCANALTDAVPVARHHRRPGGAAPARRRARCRELARELRAFVLASVAQTGGHLSSNLGTVELTIALHYVFDTPRDRIVWDVGHQTYAHKILTGRRAAMSRLRHDGRAVGLSAPLGERVRHVRHRAFVDVDLGGARHGGRREAQGRGSRRVVAVIGDGAMSAGMAFEALNNAGIAGADLLVDPQRQRDVDLGAGGRVQRLSREAPRVALLQHGAPGRQGSAVEAAAGEGARQALRKST